MFSLDKKGSLSTVKLPAVLDMSVAEDLLESLQKAVQHGPQVHVDSAKVERVSTPCLQVLISAGLEVERQDGQFKITNISKGMIRGMNDLGLSEFLNKWS